MADPRFNKVFIKVFKEYFKEVCFYHFGTGNFPQDTMPCTTSFVMEMSTHDHETSNIIVSYYYNNAHMGNDRHSLLKLHYNYRHCN